MYGVVRVDLRRGEEQSLVGFMSKGYGWSHLELQHRTKAEAEKLAQGMLRGNIWNAYGVVPLPYAGPVIVG